MANILHIDSSLKTENSASRKVSWTIIQKLIEKNPGANVKVLDLNETPIPHLNANHLSAFATPPEKRTGDHLNLKATEMSDELIKNVLWADYIVMGIPMYNFGIPSTLKSFIDQIARAGITFSYSEKGPEGLVKGKKVFLAISSGGVYSAEGFMKSLDFTEPYLRAVLGFLGMTDVKTIRAEGLAIPGNFEKAMQKALDSIEL